jgi:hypothetical protein
MLLGPWGLLSHGGAAVAWCRISYLNETFNVYFGVRVLGLSHLFACPNNKAEIDRMTWTKCTISSSYNRHHKERMSRPADGTWRLCR